MNSILTHLPSLMFYMAAFSVSIVLMYRAERSRGGKSSRVLVVFSLLIPMLVGSLRYMTGTDYGSYLEIFNSLEGMSLGKYIAGGDRTEPLFYLLAQVSGFFGGSFLFFAIPCVLTVLLFYLGLSRLKVDNLWIVWALFLLIWFPHTLSIVRQGVAVSVAFYAMSLSITDRHVAGFSVYILAVLSHYVAIVVAPVYLLAIILSRRSVNFYRVTMGIFVAFLVATVFVYFFLRNNIDILIGNRVRYMVGLKRHMYETISLRPKLLVNLLAVAPAVIWFNRVVGDSVKFKLYFFMSMMFLLASFGAVYVQTGDRLGWFFIPFLFILMASYVKIAPAREGKIGALVILYGVAYFIIMLCVMLIYGIFPYTPVWEAGNL